jgi:hypothetical protein
MTELSSMPVWMQILYVQLLKYNECIDQLAIQTFHNVVEDDFDEDQKALLGFLRMYRYDPN